MNDILIVGGGIVGLATGYQLLKKNSSLKLVVLEKESEVSKHQTGHNSGVIHSGIYYRPGSLKANNCRNGISLLLKFCKENNIKYEICGKIIIAKNNEDLPVLDRLLENGKKNCISGLKKISSDQIKNFEPYAVGKAAIYCPETGIVDYRLVSEALAQKIKEKAEIITNTKVNKIIPDGKNLKVITNNQEYITKSIINCAGLFSDKLFKASGFKRKMRIIPFRGEYYKLKNKSKKLVKNLIYPVPNLNYPFLGVHFTRDINGGIEAGPNAVLAWAREGYKKTDFNFSEALDYFLYMGFWRMAKKYWNVGIQEYYRSFFKKAFVRSLQSMVPEITEKDIIQSPSGVRAQALNINGSLNDDFSIEQSKNMIHVLNAPSPAATSSLSIGQHVANLYYENQ